MNGGKEEDEDECIDEITGIDKWKRVEAEGREGEDKKE